VAILLIELKFEGKGLFVV